MAESKAQKLAAEWAKGKRPIRHEEDDLKGHGLPTNVQEAILDVEHISNDIAERVALAEQLFEVNPEHELALEPGEHAQTSWTQRFEEVDGEIVEILKEAHDQPTQVIYRPELVAADGVDPESALQARLQHGSRPE